MFKVTCVRFKNIGPLQAINSYHSSTRQTVSLFDNPNLLWEQALVSQTPFKLQPQVSLDQWVK